MPLGVSFVIPKACIIKIFYRYGVVTEIEQLYASCVKKLNACLLEVDSVAITVDVWTDRRMRSFLGITVHYISGGHLCSSLLSCQRMMGELINK